MQFTGTWKLGDLVPDVAADADCAGEVGGAMADGDVLGYVGDTGESGPDRSGSVWSVCCRQDEKGR